MRKKYLFLIVSSACCACAQTFEPVQYELGAVIGYGIYRNGSILSNEGSVEAGIRNRIHPKVILRGEFLDFLTTFPRTQIMPAPHNTARGIFENSRRSSA